MNNNNEREERKKLVLSTCYDFTAPTEWLNLPATRKALGITSASSQWSSCNMQVNSMFKNDWMKSQQYTIPPLLANGVRV